MPLPWANMEPRNSANAYGCEQQNMRGWRKKGREEGRARNRESCRNAKRGSGKFPANGVLPTCRTTTSSWFLKETSSIYVLGFKKLSILQVLESTTDLPKVGTNNTPGTKNVYHWRMAIPISQHGEPVSISCVLVFGALIEHHVEYETGGITTWFFSCDLYTLQGPCCNDRHAFPRNR